MARIMFQQGSASWAKVEAELDRAASPDMLVDFILRTGETKGVKSQLAVVETMAQIATLRGRNQSLPTLGDEILDGQARKFQQYGEKAFCLSEKQAHAIARDMIGWQHRD